MASPYVLQTDVPISRSINFEVRLKRGLAPESSEWSCDGWETIHYESMIYGVSAVGTATIYQAGWANALLGSVWLGWEWDVGESVDPGGDLECPDSYLDTDSAGAQQPVTLWKTCGAQLYTPSGMAAWSPAARAHASYTQNEFHAQVNHMFGERLTHQVLPDAWNTATISASGTFDVMGELTAKLGTNGDFRDFLADHDPYGDPSMAHEVFLKPVGPITLAVTWGGETHSVTLTADSFESQAAFEEFFRYGFGQLQVNWNCHNNDGDGQSANMTFPTTEVARGTFSGSGIGGGEAPADYLNKPAACNSTVHFDPVTGAFRGEFNGNESDEAYPMLVECARGPFAITYTAVGADFNGAGRAGTVQLRETHEQSGAWDDQSWGTVPLNGSTTWKSRGQYSLGVSDYGPIAPGNLRKDVLDFHGAGIGMPSGSRPAFSIHGTLHTSTNKDWITHRWGGLIGLEALGEPAFPAPGGAEYWRWFDDSRCDVRSPFAALHWDDALEFDILDSMTLVNLGAAAAWTVESGAADIDYEGGTLNVHVTSGPCRLTRAISGDLTGARTVEWNYTSDDTQPVEVQLDTSVWDVTPDNTLVDVVAIKGRGGADITQIDVANNGWAGGLHAITTLALDNLRAGKTYQFGLVKGKRVAEAAGGYTQVEVSNDAFLGAARGTSNDADPYTSGKCLSLIVDGVHAVYGDQATMGAGWLSPDVTTRKGLVALGFNESSGWKQSGSANSYHLRPGIYSGYGAVIIPAYLRAAQVRLVCCLSGSRTLVTHKLLRGLIRVLLVNADSSFARGCPVTVEQRHTPEGPVVWSTTRQTDPLGCLILGPYQQGIDDHQNYYTVKARQADDSWVSAQVEVRNRNVSYVTLTGAFRREGIGETDLLIDELTGVGVLACIEADSLRVKRTFDYGITFLEPNTLSTDAAHPCVFLDHASERHVWGIAWTEAGNTIVARSTDGFATSEQDTLLNGITHTRVVAHPLSGVMLIAGFDTAAGRIVTARSFDSGISISPPTDVVACSEQAIGLTYAPTGLNTWCLSYVDGAGDHHVLWSTDNGLTWSEAA